MIPLGRPEGSSLERSAKGSPVTASRRFVRAMIAIGASCVLAAINLGIVGKERLRRDGEVVLLPLAPVDPRALLQGDYMALRFELVREIEAASAAPSKSEGVVTLSLDQRRVAHLATATDPGPKLRLRYRVRHGQVWLGTNAYFFEEGTAAQHRDARYGEFRVDPTTGEAVLVGLRGADLAPR